MTVRRGKRSKERKACAPDSELFPHQRFVEKHKHKSLEEKIFRLSFFNRYLVHFLLAFSYLSSYDNA